jgi:chemosensory pili system protein ChpA (sensor histidine kinase/response regulator)
VRLDIVGGSIEERHAGSHDRLSFEHLLRNSVTHGIELPEFAPRRVKMRSDPSRCLSQDGNEVGVEFPRRRRRPARIREAVASGLLGECISDDTELTNLTSSPLVFHRRKKSCTDWAEAWAWTWCAT